MVNELKGRQCDYRKYSDNITVIMEMYFNSLLGLMLKHILFSEIITSSYHIHVNTAALLRKKMRMYAEIK